ncbi:MAG: bifunctional 4-hydroxy-3-methylbut-2-enyl diphosphate reductase/30S ribosomal protein S1 [Clostridia bacterium]|nr:bifunctional 4-hydroxy-3-methylbut-2-enyl diphosphate reductase/30S ribosomal protein S1 [Clostridia bacterium]
MSVELAKTAGFCFGVKRAMEMVETLLADGKKVCTLGPLIHNPQTVASLAARGVSIVDDPDEAPLDATLVIRSHGVGRDVYDKIAARGLTVCDATCPFVDKIHRIVEEHSKAGAVVLIAGDEHHPEVIGIRRFCDGPSYVFDSPESLQKLLDDPAVIGDKSSVLVSQTTFQKKVFENCKKIAKKHYTNALLFDTICNATANRQQEAVELSQRHPVMVIVGGRQSSNTAKLCAVCEPYSSAHLVETAADLSPDWFAGVRSAGLTAGASTPADIIKEVQSTMSEILNEEKNIPAVSEADAPEKSFDEMSFEEALEASFNNLSNNDGRVKGIVVGINPSEVQVEVVGRKQTGYIPVDELSAEGAEPSTLVKIGDELDLLIMRTNDQEGTITLSKKRVDALKGFDDIAKAAETNEILEGKITDVVRGGVIAVAKGVRVFIPASHASAVRMEDLSPLVGTDARFRIIEVNPARRRAVGSIRSVYREERKEKAEALWNSLEVGATYKGVVKSMTTYGAFVDLGGADGMIHVSELSWKRVKHPSDVLTIGQEVEVTVKAIDLEKHKISLGYRKEEDNPWTKFTTNYNVGDVVTVKVVSMTTFGAFANIIDGVDGLIHISQISNHRVEKPEDELKIGQEVEAKIINVDADKKRISLSIRALLPEEVVEEAPVEEAAEEVAEEVAAPAEEPAEETAE